MNKLFTYTVKIPEIFSRKEYDFIFIGYESDGRLVKRKDIPYTGEPISDTFSEPISEIVFLGHIHGKWDRHRIELKAKDYLEPETPHVHEQLPENPSVQNLNVFDSVKFNELVTCVFIDETHDKEIGIIIDQYKKWGITNIKRISSKTEDISPIINLEIYSKFCLTELYKFIDTEFVLICQWDGFILNPHNFQDEFYNYDYIGAPWWFKPNSVAGNGGFSLRSKKCLIECNRLFKLYQNTYPEDDTIDRNAVNLIEAGIKFAPRHIADQFSVEGLEYTSQFGFHGLMTPNTPSWCRKIYKNKFYHSGDLGDVIYSLPVIKALGGGVLILSSDYNKMSIRDGMSHEKSMLLKELLQGQEYLVSVENAHQRPCDIDYDLNDARQQFIDWGAGKLTEEEISTLRVRNLVINYEMLYDLKNTDRDQYYTPATTRSIINKPIIINRTHRYNNTEFPWKEIINDFGDKIAFVGTVAEYHDFIKKFGRVIYYPTKTYYELMEIIAGCKLYIGNQSFGYAIAESIKQNCIQETDTWVGNCQYRRYNSLIFTDGQGYDYDIIKNFIRKYY